MAEDDKKPKQPPARAPAQRGSAPKPPPRRAPGAAPPTAPKPPGSAPKAPPPPPPPEQRRHSRQVPAFRAGGRPQAARPAPAKAPSPPEPPPPSMAESPAAPAAAPPPPAARSPQAQPPKAPKPSPAAPARGSDPRAATTGSQSHLETKIGGVEPPKDPAIVDQRVEDAKKLVKHLKSQLGESTDALRSARLSYEIARLLESPVHDIAGAAEHFRKAHELRPEHIPTLHGARRTLIAQKKFQDALPLFDTEVRITSEPHRKALLLYEKGRLLEDGMALKEDARRAYAAAVELERGDPTLLKAVERTDHQAQKWTELDSTYEAAANAVSADPRHRAAIVVERARLLESKRKDPKGAIELYETALKLDPTAPGALPALKRLHYAHGRWRDLVAVLRLEAQQATDTSVRSMALYRVGRVLADRLGVLDEAIGAMEEALAQNAQDPMLLEEIARLYELGKRWEPLVGVLERLAAKVDTPNQVVGIQHRIGQLLEERLSNEEAAIQWFGRALEGNPAYAPALSAQGNLFTKRKQWAELIEMHQGEAEAAKDVKQRAAAYARIAEIQDTQLGNPEEAAKQHARALALVPSYAPSFKALTRLYSQAGQHRALVDLYERAVEGAKDADTKITYLFKIGRVQEDALGDPGLAVHTYQRILTVDKDHLGAVHAVQRAAERAGRWKELVAALELEVTKINDDDQIVALLHRAGEVSEMHLDDDEAALTLYRKVLEKNDRYAPALTSLGRLYYRAGRWEDLLDTYRLELNLAPKGPEAAALLYKMGELCEERIGRDDEAAECYQRAIDVDPFHTPSLHALARKLREKSQWDELVKLLGLELSGLKDDHLKARTAFRMGEVFENRLGQPEKALDAYEQALAAIASFRPAADGRARLLAQAGEFSKLAEDLAREAKTSEDPTIAIAALLREGEIYRDELNEPRRAIECFDAVLTRDPKHLGALLALESLYAELGAWEPLSKLYSIEARVLTDPLARVAALRELARLQDAKGVGSAEDAKRTYFAILQLAPTDPLALAALERIALKDNDPQLLAQVDAALGSSTTDPALAAAHNTRLAESLEASGAPGALEKYRSALARDPENLAATRGLSRIAESSADPALLAEASGHEARVTRDLDAAARLLVMSAALHAERLGDPAAAARDLENALELNPDHEEAGRRIRSLLLAQGEADRLLDVLSKAAQAATKADRRAELSIACAELIADTKGDLSTAITTLQRVAGEQEGHIPTQMKLADFFMRDKHWSEAVDRFARVLNLSPLPEVFVEAHLKVAMILDEKLGDKARALSSLRAVLDTDERNREALKRLLDIQLRSDQANEAAKTAARLVEVSTATEDRADALKHLARLERAVGHPAQAVQAYRLAVELVGLEGNVAKDFLDLLVEQKLLGDDPPWDAYVASLSKYLESRSPPPEVASNIALDIARVQYDEMGTPDRALATLQQGLSRAPSDLTLRTELAKRMQQAGHLPQAVDELRKLLDMEATNVGTWRDLVNAFQALGQADRARIAMSGIAALGAANDLENATLSSNPPRAASAQLGSFNATAFATIDPHSQADAPAAQLLAALSDGLHKIHPPELERYGLSSRDRLTSKSGNPIRAVADEVARIFGVEEFDFYVHSAHSGSLEIEVTDPPAVLVPVQATSLPESRLVFLLARKIANIARSVHVIDKISPQELEILLAAAARMVDPSFGMGLADEDYLNSHSRRVAKSIAWLSRKGVEEAALAYAQAPRIDVALWVSRLRQTAARSAVVVSDDLAGAIDQIRRTEGDLAGVQGAALSQGMALVSDLLRFSVSDVAFGLRKRLGMR